MAAVGLARRTLLGGVKYASSSASGNVIYRWYLAWGVDSPCKQEPSQALHTDKGQLMFYHHVDLTSSQFLRCLPVTSNHSHTRLEEINESYKHTLWQARAGDPRLV